MTIALETSTEENAALTVLSMGDALGTEVEASLLRMVRDMPTDDRVAAVRDVLLADPDVAGTRLA
jgi:hypothetical protein